MNLPPSILGAEPRPEMDHMFLGGEGGWRVEEKISLGVGLHDNRACLGENPNHHTSAVRGPLSFSWSLPRISIIFPTCLITFDLFSLPSPTPQTVSPMSQGHISSLLEPVLGTQQALDYDEVFTGEETEAQKGRQRAGKWWC